jgi:hypothetical protein
MRRKNTPHEPAAQAREHFSFYVFDWVASGGGKKDGHPCSPIYIEDERITP